MRLTKLLFIFFIAISASTSFAQEVITLKEYEKEVTGYELQIPKELQATPYQLKNNKIIYVQKFDEKLGGTIFASGYIDANKNVKFKSVYVPSQSLARNPGCPDGYRDCARGCTQSPTTGGLITCTVYCMIDCSGNQQ